MFVPEATQPFNVSYHCYSVSMMPNAEEKMKRGDVDNGGKSKLTYLLDSVYEVLSLSDYI